MFRIPALRWIEQPEPGGVSWTRRIPSPIWVSRCVLRGWLR
jgi:hypothetical protein